MLSDRLRPVLEPLTSSAGRTLARTHVSPNALTSLGLVGTLLCAWLIADGRQALGGALLIPAAIIDVLDGALARATSRVTAWGAFYDSVCDRVGDGALLVAIAWSARATQDRLVAAALAALILSFMVSYARAKAEALSVTVGSGPGERGERIIFLIIGLISGYVEAAVWTIVALSAFTFVGRCATVRRRAA